MSTVTTKRSSANYVYTPAAEFQYIVPSQSVVDPVAVSDVRPQRVVSEHYGVILYAVARAEYNVFIMAPKLARQTQYKSPASSRAA